MATGEKQSKLQQVTEGVAVATEVSYSTAVLGYPNYWYPLVKSRDVGNKPVSVTALGQKLAIVRRQGKVYAVEDRCPHRGIPLSMGKNDFPELPTLICKYHGWVFDLPSGRCIAALPDGPDSRVAGAVRVRTYPCEERAGLVWVWMGVREPVPVEEDIPPELLKPRTVVFWDRQVRKGNWRYAAENGYDEGHLKYLHRDSVWTLFTQFPASSITSNEWQPDGLWIKRAITDVRYENEYPGVGKWPKPRPWRSPAKGRRGVYIRLPGILRVDQMSAKWVHYEWYVPVDEHHHIYWQGAAKWTGPLGGLIWKLRYLTYLRPLHHHRFNGQDAAMVEHMLDSAGPVKIFRPDVSIAGWRELCEKTARYGEQLVRTASV